MKRKTVANYKKNSLLRLYQTAVRRGGKGENDNYTSSAPNANLTCSRYSLLDNGRGSGDRSVAEYPLKPDWATCQKRPQKPENLNNSQRIGAEGKGKPL